LNTGPSDVADGTFFGREGVSACGSGEALRTVALDDALGLSQLAFFQVATFRGLGHLHRLDRRRSQHTLLNRHSRHQAKDGERYPLAQHGLTNVGDKKERGRTFAHSNSRQGHDGI